MSAFPFGIVIWNTMCWLLGRRDKRGLNGNGKNTIKIKLKKKEIHCWFGPIQRLFSSVQRFQRFGGVRQAKQFFWGGGSDCIMQRLCLYYFSQIIGYKMCLTHTKKDCPKS